MDYTNYARVKDGAASRTPLPMALWAIPPDGLLNLEWLPDDYGVRGCQWWPIDDQSTPLSQYQSYGDETLTMDRARTVVVALRPVTNWTAAEILAYKGSITRRISKAALRKRLTLDERIAFEMAQLDDLTATADVRQAAAGLRVMEKDLNAGAHIDLNDAGFQASIRQLESLGIIAADRADQIIWADITPAEAP